MPVDVSIIIVSYNTREVLLECLRSLSRWESSRLAEIIVVDNASHDGSAEAVAQHFPQVSVLRHDRNLGFAGANNQGIKVARGKYLLLLNPDTLFIEDALTPILEFMESTPRAGIAGCKILNADHSLQPSYFPFPNLATMSWIALFLDRLLPLNHIDGRWRLGRREVSSPVRVQRLLGAYLFVRRRVIEEVGPMDESFFLFCEEEDFCYRVAQHGWELYYVPGVRMIHWGGQSTAQNSPAATLFANASKVQFFRKHFGRPAQLFFRVIWFFAVILRMPSVLALPSPMRGQMFTAYAKSLAALFQPLAARNS